MFLKTILLDSLLVRLRQGLADVGAEILELKRLVELFVFGEIVLGLGELERLVRV